MKWLKKLWCRMRHQRHWHEQVYTDRARYYLRTECWACRCEHTKLRPQPLDFNPDAARS